MNETKDDNTGGENLPQRFIEIRLSLIEYAAEHTLDELLTYSLDEVGALLDSPIGFYHFVKPDQKTLSLQQWSTRTVKEFCRTKGEKSHYDVDRAGVWVDCLHQKKPVIHNDYPSLAHRKGMPEGHAKVDRELVVPVIRKEKVVAIFGVGNKPVNYTQRDVEVISYLADVTWQIVLQKRAEEALRKTTDDLHERVKELRCLYGISELVENNDLTLNEILQRTVGLLPPSWQYPEITCAQITVDNRSYRTKEFRRTVWSQTQKIRVNRENIGVLEVFLLEERPEKGEGPFLLEERSLLNAVAERLGRIIEHKRANEALQQAHDELQARVEERTRELAAQNLQLLNEIRERKKMEEDLRRISEKIKLFAFSVAHDLKNPAISTHGLARILNKKYGSQLSDSGKKICKQIQQSAEDIESLVDKINLFISAKETPLNIERISPEEIWAIIQEEFSSQLKNRVVQWSIPDNMPAFIVADRLALVRIFRNIIENSLKYGGDRLSRIDIGYRFTDALHIFTVSDDGQGVKGKYSKDIFDWFERDTDSREIHGTGMGLAIVREIAASHGGKVWREPARPKGVTFCVSLSRHLQVNTTGERE